MTVEQNEFLSKEIRGINARMLLAMLSSVICIEATILAVWFKMDTRITIVEHDNAVQQEKIKNLESVVYKYINTK